MATNSSIDDDDELGIVDFGQKVDLCQRIRDVLINYPEGALLKVWCIVCGFLGALLILTISCAGCRRWCKMRTMLAQPPFV